MTSDEGRRAEGWGGAASGRERYGPTPTIHTPWGLAGRWGPHVNWHCSGFCAPKARSKNEGQSFSSGAPRSPVGPARAPYSVRGSRSSLGAGRDLSEGQSWNSRGEQQGWQDGKLRTPVSKLQIEMRVSANGPQSLPPPARGPLPAHGPAAPRPRGAPHQEHRASPTQGSTGLYASH